jgi:hypothetical protein
LNDYLTGKLANSTVQMLEDTASAPLHNLLAERALDMMYAQWRQVRITRFGFIDGKVKATQNGTLQWPDTLGYTEQSSLVDFAVNRGAKAMLLWTERERTCCIACARKLLDRTVNMEGRKDAADVFRTPSPKTFPWLV